MKLIKRSAWGARHGRGSTNITPSRGGVTIHYEGGGKLTGRPHSQCAARVRAIEAYHVGTNGWSGIAYNYLACEHGYVFEGRGLGRRSAANGTTSGNQNYYAVCALIGDADPLADALLNALRDAIDYLRSNGAGRKVNGHRDHLPTSCPGSRLYAWVKAGAHRPSPPVASKGLDMDPREVFDAVWNTDATRAPKGPDGKPVTPDNLKWRPEAHLVDINQRLRTVEAQQAEILELLRKQQA